MPSRATSKIKLSPNGTPADPAEFHLWSIKRHANSNSSDMLISGKPSVLLPEIGQLDHHLRTLTISHTEITDISPLSELPSLNKLKILASPVSDWSPLDSLKSLEELELYVGSEESIIVPYLPKLRSLKIFSANGDIALGHLPNLEIAEFQVLNDLSEITNQPQLKELHFKKIANPTLEPLESAKNLRTLNIQSHDIVDLSHLAALPNIERLRILMPAVTNISPLGKLNRLIELEILGVKATHVEPLRNLEKLTKLQLLFQAPLDDLSFLSGTKNLSSLSICPSSKADLSVLTELPKLKDLGLPQIDPNVCIAPLTACLALQKLSIFTDKNQVTHDPRPLPAPPRLVSLNLSWNGLESLKGLEGCCDLQRLYCSRTNIDCLKPLEGMKNLVELSLGGSNVSDLSILITLPRFLAEDPEVKLAIKNTPAVEKYPELAATADMESGRDGDVYKHKTALNAIRLLQRLI